MAESGWTIGKYSTGGKVWKKSRAGGQVPNALGTQAPSHAAHGRCSGLGISFVILNVWSGSQLYKRTGPLSSGLKVAVPCLHAQYPPSQTRSGPSGKRELHRGLWKALQNLDVNSRFLIVVLTMPPIYCTLSLFVACV